MPAISTRRSSSRVRSAPTTLASSRAVPTTTRSRSWSTSACSPSTRPRRPTCPWTRRRCSPGSSRRWASGPPSCSPSRRTGRTPSPSSASPSGGRPRRSCRSSAARAAEHQPFPHRGRRRRASSSCSPRSRTEPGRSTILAEAIERDKRALERGVRMRTLYQHSARRSVATREYVEEVVDVRRRGAHPGRVLQPADRGRPTAGDRPGRGGLPGRGRDPRRRAWSPTSSTSSSATGSGRAASPTASCTPSARSPTTCTT